MKPLKESLSVRFLIIPNRWTTGRDRALLMSIALLGMAIAGCTNFPLSSALCFSGVDGGWPMVFYVQGTLHFLY